MPLAVRKRLGVARHRRWKFELPPSIRMSSGSIRPDSSTIVSWVISPAGSITQTARGVSSLRTNSARSPLRRRLRRPVATHRVGAFIVDDAAMAVPHQPPHDIAAHPAQTDHPKLHRLSPAVDTQCFSTSPPAPAPTRAWRASSVRRRRSAGRCTRSSRGARSAKNIEIAARLRRLDNDTESWYFWPGTAMIVGIVAGDLQERSPRCWGHLCRPARSSAGSAGRSRDRSRHGSCRGSRCASFARPRCAPGCGRYRRGAEHNRRRRPAQNAPSARRRGSSPSDLQRRRVRRHRRRSAMPSAIMTKNGVSAGKDPVFSYAAVNSRVLTFWSSTSG